MDLERFGLGASGFRGVRSSKGWVSRLQQTGLKIYSSGVWVSGFPDPVDG